MNVLFIQENKQLKFIYSYVHVHVRIIWMEDIRMILRTVVWMTVGIDFLYTYIKRLMYVYLMTCTFYCSFIHHNLLEGSKLRGISKFLKRVGGEGGGVEVDEGKGY